MLAVQVFEDVASSLEDTLFPLREDGLDRRACPNCKDGRLYLNGSPRGAFVACSNYRQKGTKQCTFIRNFSGEVQTGQEWEVGMHPVHKSLMYIKEGRYGRCCLTILLVSLECYLRCKQRVCVTGAMNHRHCLHTLEHTHQKYRI